MTRKKLQSLLLKAIAGTLTGAVLLTASLTYALKSARFNEFSHECRAIHKGMALEEVRVNALQKGFLMEADPSRYSTAQEDFFILRPNQQWPAQFACHFAAGRGIVTQTYR